jgi:hypothetical protein
MHTNGNITSDHETDTLSQPRFTAMEACARMLSTSPHPFHGLSSISRDIVASAERLPDAELMRIAGCLRTMADEVMAVIDRRCGARPAPRLIIDNTRR